MSTIVRMELRHRAMRALLCPDPTEKRTQVRQLFEQAGPHTLDPTAQLQAPDLPLGAWPGRPPKPHLVVPAEVPQRSPFTTEGRAALVHAICHIEFNAINLALDAVWRFPGMPDTFYLDWLRVAAEEAFHFGLLQDHLAAMPHLGQPWAYGDFVAHDGLWTMCDKTAGDVVARMALVPRTLEARGLDATPLIQAKLRKVNTPDALAAVSILDTILRDEVGHVAIGNHWYRWLCAREGLDPVSHYQTLTQRYQAPRLKPPFNTEARRKAGFTTPELAYLLGA